MFETKEVSKTRKKFICFWCGEKIPEGNSAVHVKGFVFNTISRGCRTGRYCHVECADAMIALDDYANIVVLNVGLYFRGSTDKRYPDGFETDEFYD